MIASMNEPEQINLELDCVTGVVTLVGGRAPRETSWLPEIIDVIKRGESMWCALRGDVIEMRIQPETLWYRLTGEVDDFGGEVAVRCDADGKDWPDAQHS
jgi:hypothetical protein